MSKKHKTILLIIASVIGGVILFAINIFPYFIQSSNSDQQGSDTRVNYNVNLDSIWDLGKLKDIGKEPTEESREPYYRDNMQDALRDGRIIKKEEDQYMKNIDEIIKKIEGESGVLLFYKAVKDKNQIAIILCEFNIREKDGIKQYVAIRYSPSESHRNSKMYGTHKGVVEDKLKAFPYMQNFSPDPNKKILYGYSETENIYSLKIEGQKLDEIIPYEEFGNTCYLWYYLDLQTNGKQPSEMVVEMDE